MSTPTGRKEDTGYEDNFRDHLGNITRDGKRLKIYPKRPSGRYHSARRIASWFLLAFLFTGPLLRINGQPLLLLNIIDRKFVFFGVPFWPQDLYLFMFAMLSMVVFIVLFTAVFGRLWCGWACPQTIFLEMVFRKIEYWIEGDAVRQRRLDVGPWTREKIAKKALKHSVYFVLSFFIANTFLAYIVGSEALWKIVTDPPQEHLSGLITITIFSLVFYGVFARFREQACVMVCPYGRWQSVMVNEDTIAVTYDHVRGEPRGKIRHAAEGEEEQGEQGDCIDCGQCVHVCPTGIDIRNGIQLECVNCTACIDECDHIMDRVGRERGLIRYTSLSAVEKGARRLLTPRVVGYVGVLTVLLCAATYFFSNRAEIQAVILREPGKLYTELADGRLANFYSMKVLNKTFAEIPVEIRLEEPAGGEIVYLGEAAAVQPQAILEGRFFVALPKYLLLPGRTDVRFSVYAGGQLVGEEVSSFLAPHDIGEK
ncbi:MAG: cytochrome c oxidase accessory protein FixG [Candidatus Latescibacterota bacterium]|jgi:cytochrome c oxidase accessory protein FixG